MEMVKKEEIVLEKVEFCRICRQSLKPGQRVIKIMIKGKEEFVLYEHLDKIFCCYYQ
jgi:hypothetical protein